MPELVLVFRVEQFALTLSVVVVVVVVVVVCRLGGYRSVDNLVSVVGSLGCVSLAITLPALFHRKVAKEAARVQRHEPPEEELVADGGLAAAAAAAAFANPALARGDETVALLAPMPSPAIQSLTPMPRWRFLGGASCDLVIVVAGAAGTVLAVVVAVQCWIDSTFEFQPCVVRNITA